MKTKTCKSAELQSTWNKDINLIGDVFVLIFLAEALLKITALGFVCGHKTYLRNGWNVLDFTILTVGIIDFALYRINILSDVNLTVIRTLRVLRPLKGLKIIPSLRKQIQALIKSIRILGSVLIFLQFIFLLFSIVGLQLFVNDLHYACRVG